MPDEERNKSTVKVTDLSPLPVKAPTDDAELMELARKQASRGLEAVRENYDKCIEDLTFAYAEDQWDTDIKNARGADRPALTINDLPAFSDKVEGTIRRSLPAISVRPVDSKGDVKTANILGGLIRNIENSSEAEIAYTTAGQMGATGGHGVIRVLTEYADDDVFEQNIRIAEIEDPFSVVFDSDAKKKDRSDGLFAFIFSDIHRDSFKERWPNAVAMEFDGDAPIAKGHWAADNTVRIAEWFLKEKVKKTIYQLQDGRVVDKLEEEDVSVKERKVDGYKIVWRLISGDTVLEGPIDWPGKKYIPLSPVWGKQVNIQGKRHIRGMFRYSKDAQKSFNYWWTAHTEAIALSPKAPYMVTPKMVAGHEKQWRTAHLENYPYMLYNIDPANPNAMPKREMAGTVVAGMTDAIGLAQTAKKDTIGMYEASLGKRSNETSGKAIRERAQQGDLGNYSYIDNLARGIRHIGRILLDVIPNIYDTEREQRILNEDETEEYVVLNQETGDGSKLNDLALGKYDVTMKVGTNSATQRTEAVAEMTELMQYAPSVAPLIADLVAENSDWRGAQKLAKRLRKALPPEMQEKEEGEGKQEGATPEQVDQMIQGAIQQSIQETLQGLEGQKAQLEIQKEQLDVEEAQTKLEQERTKLEGLKIQNQIKQAELGGKEESIKETVKQMMERGEL